MDQPTSSSPKCAWMRGFCLHPKHFRCGEDACVGCADRMERPRGAGDVVHAITTATGIAAAVDFFASGCDGCQRRRDALNRAIPFTDEQTKEH